LPAASRIFVKPVEPATVHTVGLCMIVSRAPHTGRFEHRGQTFDQPARLGREPPVDAGVERRLVRRFVNDRRGVFRPIGFTFSSRLVEQELAIVL